MTVVPVMPIVVAPARIPFARLHEAFRKLFFGERAYWLCVYCLLECRVIKKRFKTGIGVGLLVLVSWLEFAGYAHGQTTQRQYALAAAYYSRGQWAEAEVAFQEFMTAYPDANEQPLAQFYFAETLMQRQQFDRAYLVYQRYLQQFPTHEFFHRATFRMAESAYRLKNYDVSIGLFEEFIKLNPHHELNEFGLFFLGNMRLQRNELQLAQRVFETALRLYPNGTYSNRCRFGLAKSLQFQGNETQSRRFYEFLLTEPDRELQGKSYLQLGLLSFNDDELEQATSQLTKAIEICESTVEQAEAAYWLSRIYAKQDNQQKALEVLQQVNDEKLPERLAVSISFDAAVLATETNNQTIALKHLNHIKKQFPDHAMADDALWLAIGIHQQRGDALLAIEQSEIFLKKYPNSQFLADVLELKGRQHYDRGEYRLTVETFDQLLKDQTQSERYQDRRAIWLYLKSVGHLGRSEFDEAIGSLSSIDENEQPDDLVPLVQIALATAQFGAGNYADAIPSYQSYLQHSLNSEKSERARIELLICLAETHNWEMAKALVTEIDNDSVDQARFLKTLVFLAEVAYQNEAMEHAKSWYQMLARPDNPREIVKQSLTRLAWIDLESANVKDTQSVFSRLLTEFPAEAAAGEIAMARAKYLEDNNQSEAALQLYTLVSRRLGSAEIGDLATLRLAYLLKQNGDADELDRARTLLREYVDSSIDAPKPLVDEALYQLAWLLHDIDEKPQSRRRFEQLVNNHSHSKYWPDAAYRLIQLHLHDDDPQSAKPLIQRLVAMPDVPKQILTRVLLIQGKIATSEKRWADVAESMRLLIDQTEDESIVIQAKYWLAESLYQRDQFEQSLEMFSELLPKSKQLDQSLEPWILLRIAQGYSVDENWTRAREVAESAIERFPGFQSRYEFDFVIARALEDIGKLTDARKAYDRVIESEQGNSTETATIAQWRIGETYFHQDSYAEAIKAYYLVESLSTFPHWQSAALLQAGKCQEHLSNFQHAKKLYTELLAKFPETEFANPAKQRLAGLDAREKLLNARKAEPTESRR